MPVGQQNIEHLIDTLSGRDAVKILGPCYNFNDEIIQQRIPLYRQVLNAFRRFFPEDHEIILLRVPGRINLMGVHIDHQGGWCNYMAIARETLFCFSPRSDDILMARNLFSRYPGGEFSISQEFPSHLRGDWLKFIETSSPTRGDWINYLKAGALKLQDHFEHRPVRGMNVVIGGDIPPKSGLSSSSTLVVGTMMALRELNGFELTDSELVELCGEGEWFVGTRGGAGDHAAMIMSRMATLTHIGFKPLRFEPIPFPSDYEVILCHSGIEAAKATNARAIFNNRIAAYHIALALYRLAHPGKRDRIHLLRDVNPELMDMPLSEFYRSLKTVPVSIRLCELIQNYPELTDDLQRIRLLYGDSQEGFPLREVMLFGIGECERAKQFPRYIRENDFTGAGELMYISHDGDRVTEWQDKRSTPYRSSYDDRFLDELARHADLNSERLRLSPAYQPGGYRCSVPELDRVVDRCKQLRGVLGAGLTGAGMGGAVLVLVRSEESENVVHKLRALVGEWTKEEPIVEICRPVAGASFIRLTEPGKRSIMS